MKVSDIDPARLEALNAGAVETTTLVECFALDFAAVLAATGAPVGPDGVARVRAAANEGIVRRMALVGGILADRFPDGLPDAIAAHRSDTVRGWACFALAARPGVPVSDRLQALRPFADDPHFGVREWAWLAVRPHIAAALDAALEALAPWTAEPSPRLRRFASEATRPNGVWCAHLTDLKQAPERGLPILEPLRADPDRYVQDSVANWLNDAAKADPVWVRTLCDRWRAESPTPATARIRKRALRSLDTPARPRGRARSGG